MEQLIETLIETMRQAWSARTPGFITSDGIRENAVAVPLLEQNGELCVLFEERSGKLRSQPGEICFPGGAVEPGESPEQAALRETREELLVGEEQVLLLAPLDTLHTPANLIVHPFLAFLKEYRETFSRDEVERVFAVPLSWLLKQEPKQYETRVITVPGEDFPYELIPGGRDYSWRQGRYQVLFYRYENAVIWGMTAKILYSFIEMYRNEF